MSNFDINKFLDELSKKNFGRNLFLFVFGMVISAFAFNLFFDRYSVVPTGSGGLALMLSRISNIDLSLMVLIVNIILLLMGFMFFGFDYGLKMLYVTLLYPCFVKSISFVTNLIDLEDTSLFLIMVIGGAMLGLSSGLIRKSNYSPGGFCVIFDLLNKYLHISIGTATTIVNLLVIGFSYFVFGLSSSIYAIVALLVSSYIVDRVIIGISDNKVFYIITEKPVLVKDYITDTLHYDVTVVRARGGYSNDKKKMLMCVVPTIEYVKLKELVREIDSKVFFLIVDVYESSVKKNCKNM